MFFFKSIKVNSILFFNKKGTLSNVYVKLIRKTEKELINHIYLFYWII